MEQVVEAKTEKIVIQRNIHAVQWRPHQHRQSKKIPWSELPATLVSKPTHKKMTHPISFLYAY